MNVPKQAAADYAIREPIARRWSLYGFAGRAAPEQDLRSFFEATGEEHDS